MNKLFFFGLLFLLSGGVMAQNSEAYWNPAINPTPTDAQAIVSALTGAGAGTGGGTQAIINQSGSGNRFGFDGAAGNTGNAITFNQAGMGNQLDFGLAGSNNTYTFTQSGNNNVLNLQNFSTNNARLEVEQVGNGNRLQSNGYLMADSSIPLKITQSGGMSLIITQSFVP